MGAPTGRHELSGNIGPPKPLVWSSGAPCPSGVRLAKPKLVWNLPEKESSK